MGVKKNAQDKPEEVKGFEEVLNDPINNLTLEETSFEEISENLEEQDDNAEAVATVDFTKIDTTVDLIFSIKNEEVNMALLEVKKKEYSALKIDGHLDKAGYDAVKLALAKLRTTRTTLIKTFKADISPVKDWLKSQGENVDKLEAKIKEIEEDLKSKKKAIDDQVEIERQRKAQEELLKSQERVNNLFSLGAIFDKFTSIYSFPYDDNLIINALQVKEFSDDEYKKELDIIQSAYDADQQRIADEKQADLDEINRIKEQGSKLNDREQALQDKQIKLRSKELYLLDADFDTDLNTFVVKGVSVTMDSIIEFDDDQWEAVIARIESNENISEAENKNETPAETKVQSPPSFGAGGSTGGYAPPGDFAEFDVPDEDPELKNPADTPEPDFKETADPGFEEESSIDDEVGPHLTEIWFTPEKPFIDIRVSKSMMRLYHPAYEELANTIDPTNIVDCGAVGEEQLMFIIYKPLQK